MRKFMLVCVTALLIFGILGCSTRGSSSEVTNTSNTDAQVLDETGKQDESYEKKKVTLTEEDVNAMKDFLKGCSYMVFMQSIENGVDGAMTYSTTRYGVSANMTQKVFSETMKYIQVNGTNQDGVGFKIMTDGNTVIESVDGVWQDAEGKYDGYIIDINQFSSAKDLYEYLISDVALPVGKEGVAVGDTWTFDYGVEEGNSNLLGGLNYDTIGSADYKFTFREKEGVLHPDTVFVRVVYTIEGVPYYVAMELQFNSFGDTKIAMPKVGSSE